MVNQYSYRKEFGLTYEEYMNEPVHIHAANVHILKILAKQSRARKRMLERKAQRQ